MKTIYVKTAKGKALLLHHIMNAKEVFTCSIDHQHRNDVFEVPDIPYVLHKINPERLLVEVANPDKFHKLGSKPEDMVYIDETKDQKLRAETERAQRNDERRKAASKPPRGRPRVEE